MVSKSLKPRWEEDFHIDLEGARGMRILLYEEDLQQIIILRDKAEVEVQTYTVYFIFFILIRSFYNTIA